MGAYKLYVEQLMYAPVPATIGTILYDATGVALPKKRKNRGQESHGMICAEDELGLEQP
jgi:hypothetical protein